MRVAVVLPRGGRFCAQHPNSMETVVRTLCAASQDRRTTTVICDEGAEHVDGSNVMTVSSGLSRRAREAAVADLIGLLRPDHVEYHQHLQSAAAVAGRVRGPSQTFYRHTDLKRPANLIEGLRYRARLRRFDQLVFVSDAARSAFLRDYPTFGDVAVSVVNPVDAAAWSGDAMRKDKNILFSGRPTQDKGFDLVCGALSSALERHRDWTATLMLAEFERHQGWAQACLDPLARFADRVRVVRSGAITAVQSAARSAAIALVPSRAPETLGLSAIEAHAAGAAVISSGRGGLGEASGPNAVYIDPDQPNALFEAMADLIADAPRRLRLARAGQAYARSVHTPMRRAGELDSLRRSLAPRPGLRAQRFAAVPGDGAATFAGVAGF